MKDNGKISELIERACERTGSGDTGLLLDFLDKAADPSPLQIVERMNEAERDELTTFDALLDLIHQSGLEDCFTTWLEGLVRSASRKGK